ncbi:cullin binding protein [Aureococcus anophagefferens]|uniref:Defective in cullin neddylation protein n=1 Tax=Aureococcus anophagefferens TaxID=44056 RepID=A0ABR1G2S4_AURAN
MRRRVSSGARRREPEPPTYDAAAIQALFDTWADDVEGGAMGMDGLVDLCGALEIDPASDVRLLALLWRLGAKQPALILREEWAEGMAAIGCDSLEKLKAYAPRDGRAFRDFFKFVFLFSREGTHRTIEKDIVAALLPIAIGDRSAHTADTVAPDFEGYEEDGAWPLLLDGRVEQARADKAAV